jgi:hypothetical protein
MYRKMDKNYFRNFTCIQPAFEAYRTQLTGKEKNTIRTSVIFRFRKTIKILHLLFICTWFLPWKNVRRQANRNIYAYSVLENVTIMIKCSNFDNYRKHLNNLDRILPKIGTLSPWIRIFNPEIEFWRKTARTGIPGSSRCSTLPICMHYALWVSCNKLW